MSFSAKSNSLISLQLQDESKSFKNLKLFGEPIDTHFNNRPIQEKMRKYSNILSQSKTSLSSTSTYLSNQLYYNNIKDNEGEFYISDLSLDGSDNNEDNNFSFNSSGFDNETESFDEKTLINDNDNNNINQLN
jgi:hypothetical protein